MSILFCKKCDGILKVRAWEDQIYLICRKCKTKIKSENPKVSTTEKFGQKEVGVGSVNHNDKTGYDFKCPECSNDKCKVIDLGIMYGDEDWIYLLRCTNCDYGERIGEMC